MESFPGDSFSARGRSATRPATFLRGDLTLGGRAGGLLRAARGDGGPSLARCFIGRIGHSGALVLTRRLSRPSANPALEKNRGLEKTGGRSESESLARLLSPVSRPSAVPRRNAGKRCVLDRSQARLRDDFGESAGFRMAVFNFAGRRNMNQTPSKVQMKIAVIGEVGVFQHDRWSIAERVDGSSYLDSGIAIQYLASASRFFFLECFYGIERSV